VVAGALPTGAGSSIAVGPGPGFTNTLVDQKGKKTIELINEVK